MIPELLELDSGSQLVIHFSGIMMGVLGVVHLFKRDGMAWKGIKLYLSLLLVYCCMRHVA